MDTYFFTKRTCFFFFFLLLNNNNFIKKWQSPRTRKVYKRTKALIATVIQKTNKIYQIP
jgi:hypothetical protein